jgi:DNA-binding CsgD family transcriptional regulator
VAPATGVSSASDRAFVGRERQLSALLDGLDGAVAGRGRLLLVGGEPGIGKSRLAEEFASQALGRGARVVWGRSWEAGGAPAYWPWIQSLRSLLPTVDLEAVLPADLANTHLVQILPELRGHLPDVPEVTSTSPDSARFDLFVAVSRLLQRASQDIPLVVILDDLHAADASSLLLLRFVCESGGDHRTVVVGTYRDSELTKDHPLAATLPELLRTPGATRISMPGLAEAHVAQLIETIPRLHLDGLAAAVHRKTDGNPLFVQEYLRLLESESQTAQGAAGERLPIPEGVREVIGQRIDRLPASCTELLRLAAVAGREFLVDVLERASAQNSDFVLDTLQDAIEARLVEEVHGEPGRLRFGHALIRDTIYESMPAGERCRRHVDVGQALEAASVADPGPFAAELAHHFFEAGPVGDQAKTVAYATLAGTRAVESLAYEEAVRLFQMALRPLQESSDERRRCQVLVLLGDAQARAGDQPSSKETFAAAASIAVRIHDAVLLAHTALGYGGRFPWARAGGDAQLIPLIRQALAALPEADDPLRARLLARLAGALRDEPAPELRASLGEEAVAMARRLGEDDTLTYALLGWWSAALMGPDELQRQLSVAIELDELAQRGRDRELRSDAVWVRYIASMTRGDMWEARRQHGLQLELAAELQQGPQHWYSGLLATVMALHEGRLDDAETLVDETLALGRQAQTWDAEIARRFAQFVLRREQDRLAELEADLRRGITSHPGYRSQRCMLLTLLVDGDRLDEARGLFDQLAANDFAAFPKDNEWLFALTLLAETAVSLDDHPRAETLYEQLLPYAGLVALAASEVSVGPVDRPLGQLAAALGRRTDAVTHFEAAIAACKRMGTRPWLAHSQHAYAAMLAARGTREDRQRAIDLAVAARDTALEIGLTALRGRIDSLLAGLGAPRAAAGSAGDRLTRREREVAGLVAAGMSNRQIAEQLFVSERTAETHVQNILTKLGFSSRSQVAAWAVRVGIAAPT